MWNAFFYLNFLWKLHVPTFSSIFLIFFLNLILRVGRIREGPGYATAQVKSILSS